MKKVVAFLLAFLIFTFPVTTLVKADVVIGDNNENIINENATILGRKLALLESLSDLALSGVTEFSISNTNDVDSYLDYLWDELDDAIESLSNGTGFSDISNELKSKYFTNLVQYKDYITNRGNYLCQLLPSGSPTTSLLSTFFANNIFGKQTTQHYDLALDMFRALSRANNDNNSPSIPTDIQLCIDIMNKREYLPNRFWFWEANTNSSAYKDGIYVTDRTWFTPGSSNFSLNNFNNSLICFKNQIQNIYINTINGEYNCQFNWGNDRVYSKTYGGTFSWANSPTVINGKNYINWRTGDNYYSQNFNHSGSLIQIFNALKDKVKNVNIYVDNVPWATVGDVTTSQPTLDIDGLLKIYGNDNPPQYQLQPNTKIDYDQLYQVIYNAIRDNLPISQGDINYYDSHDTIYSPKIINNYGEEEGDESDLIDTILDYSVIPKFDTAIAQPMRQALTNGVVIMNNSINNVIPQEILLILGACFFLLLFAVVINRMIK